MTIIIIDEFYNVSYRFGKINIDEKKCLSKTSNLAQHEKKIISFDLLLCRVFLFEIEENVLYA